MALIAHRFHSIEADGPWTSPPFPPKEHRHIVQGVIGGFIMKRPRWAEDLDGNFIYGLDAKGKEMKSAPSARTATTSPATTSRHAKKKKKKPPAQLDREIALIAHRFHSIEADGPWASPPFPPKEHRHIVQGVIGGFIMKRPRWAEDLDGNFIYGLDAKGYEIKSAPSARTAMPSRHHATKKKSPAQLDREKSPAQLDKEIALALRRKAWQEKPSQSSRYAAASRRAEGSIGGVESRGGAAAKLFSVQSIHEGTDWAVIDATTEDITHGFAMTHSEAVKLAGASAREHRGSRWFDMSSGS